MPDPPDPTPRPTPRLPPADMGRVQTLLRVASRSVPAADTLRAHALELLGTSAAAVAVGGVPAGLVSGHTHYFDGFALMLATPMATAVALAPSAAGAYELRTGGWRVRWSGDAADADYALDADDPAGPGRVSPEFARALVRVAAEVLDLWPSAGPVRLAVASSAFASLSDGAFASFVVALGEVLAPHAERRERVRRLRRALSDALYPFSIAYLTEAAEGPPPGERLRFALHNTDPSAPERVTIDAPARPGVAWALLAPERPAPRPGRVRVRLRQAQAALDALRARGLDGPVALREVSSERFERILERIDAGLHAPARYLAGENRRVGRAWQALVRGDAQQLGALLLAGVHARHAWMGARPGVADAVARVEDALADGMYGVGLSGHARALLLVGHPLVLPGVLDDVHARVSRATEGGAHALLM